MIYIVNILLVMSLLSANSLSLEDNGDGTWNVNYSSDTAIGGFQFNLDGATASAGSGGEAGAAGFVVSAGGSTVLGFSFSGASMPVGDLLMTILTVSGAPTGLSNIAISDGSGNSIDFCYGFECDLQTICDDESACNNGETGDCIYSETNYDCDGVCIVDLDCNGDCGGSAVFDGCANCVGGNTNEEACPVDCDGVTGGTSLINECGVCVAGGEDNFNCVQGCDGNWVDIGHPVYGTVLLNDECGVCDGDNSSCSDCEGTPNGNSELDACGECGGDNSSCFGCMDQNASNYDEDAIFDDDTCICDSIIDECGVCNGNNQSCGSCTDPNATNYSGDSSGISCGYGCCSYSASTNPVQFQSIDLGGYLNPGETIYFKVTAYNGCSENLLLSSCQISTQNPYVTIIEDFGNLNNIDQGSTAETTGSFEIQVSDETPPGTKLYFQIKFIDTNPLGGCIGEDNPSYDTFFIPIQPFKFLFTNVDDDDNPDSNGDGDSICEPDETIEFLPIMESVNSSYSNLYNVLGTLSSNDTTETEIYEVDEQSGYGWWSTSPTSILVWDGRQGASGIVDDTWTFNPNANGWIPEYDYVFDYKLNQVKEVPLIIYFEAEWSSYTDKLQWYNSHIINEGLDVIGGVGCTDMDACNYDPNATADDANCWFPNDGCTCNDAIGAQVDCAGVCNGVDMIDDCGVCGGNNWSPVSQGCAGDCPDWECPDNLDLSEQIVLPVSYGLASYPNPFNPSTRINYSLPEFSNVLIQIYDSNGALATELVNKSFMPGEYSVTWDASNYSSGVYFVRLIAVDYINTEKLLLIK